MPVKLSHTEVKRQTEKGNWSDNSDSSANNEVQKGMVNSSDSSSRNILTNSLTINGPFRLNITTTPDISSMNLNNYISSVSLQRFQQWKPGLNHEECWINDEVSIKQKWICLTLCGVVNFFLFWEAHVVIMYLGITRNIRTPWLLYWHETKDLIILVICFT